MADFFASGHVADVVLVVMAVEILLLGLYRHVAGRGPTLTRVLPTILSGGCLVIALRFALTGDPWPWIAVPLTGALVAHLWDLSRQR